MFDVCKSPYSIRSFSHAIVSQGHHDVLILTTTTYFLNLLAFVIGVFLDCMTFNLSRCASVACAENVAPLARPIRSPYLPLCASIDTINDTTASRDVRPICPFRSMYVLSVYGYIDALRCWRVSLQRIL